MVNLRKIVLLIGASICCCGTVNAQQPVRIDLAHTLVQTASKPLLAPDAATKDYGFFCRQELKGDKALPMPVRFRLGSMQQNDYLERKPNAAAPIR